MAKFYGVVGYAETNEDENRPGVWTETITEREYFGDVLANNVRRQPVSDSTNDDVVINNRISIVADPYAVQHFHAIRYVEFMGAKIKVTYIDVKPPRLILTLGGVYNGR